jgi:iron complex outermembrane receptor protein
VDLPQVDTTFKPEFLTAYEFGSRNQFFDNTLKLNAEAFYWKLRDQQIPFVGFDPVGQVTLVTYNAGSAHMEGGSLDATWKPAPRDTFDFGVQYEHSVYDSFKRTIPSLSVLPSTRCNIGGYGGPFSLAPATVDCAGQPLFRAPTWSGSASYQHDFNLDGVGDVLFKADTTFASATYQDLTYTPLFRASSYALFNGSLTYYPRDNAVSLTAWIRNIADRRSFSGGGQLVDFYSRPGLLPPRTFGITARYTF